MTATPSRARRRRPDWSEKRAGQLRPVDPVPAEVDQPAELAPGAAVCFGCDWQPDPGTSSAVRDAIRHTDETGHVTFSRYR